MPSSLPTQSVLGRKLLVSILLFSSLVTLLLTCLQLWDEYRGGIERLTSRLQEAERVALPMLQRSLWSLDYDQVALELKGLCRTPGVVRAEVEIEGGKSIYEGEASPDHHRAVRSVAIEYPRDGRTTKLGTLRIHSSTEEILQTLRHRVLVLFLSQGAKTFLISFF